MAKIRVCLSGIFYPCAILRYFEAALERRDDVELITAGPYTGAWIPWRGGMDLPIKYAKSPTFPLPRTVLGIQGFSPSLLETQIKDIDVWIQVDAGWYLNPKPKAKHVVHVATDAHVLNYTVQRGNADVFYNMHREFAREGDLILPYAADPIWHAPLQDGEEIEKIYDVCLIGLQYPQRNKLVNVLRARKLQVFYDIGQVFEKYREIYLQSKVAISWSSKGDLIARVFETMNMGIPLVCDRVKDLKYHFVEGDHYLGFTSITEAEEQVMKILADYDNYLPMAQQAQKVVSQYHLYDHRIQKIFDDLELA